MKNVLLKIGEVVCLVLLVVFIAFVSTQNRISKAPFDEVSSSVTSQCELDGLLKRDSLKLKKVFSFETDVFEEFIYYSSDSVMDVREILVIKLKDTAQQKEVTDSIEKYVTEKQSLFEGYAPKESELLSSYVLVVKSGYVLFYVGETAENVSSAFQQSI